MMRLVLLTALLSFVMLQGCSSSSIAPGEVSDSAVVLGVPVVEQEGKYECGNASLSMLLAYYAHTPDAERVLELKSKAEASEEGLSGKEMLDFLDSEGFDTVLFPGTMTNEVDGIFYHLDRARPLLVSLSQDGTKNHFVLVTGYDPEFEKVFLQDPVRGAISLSNWEFEEFWGNCKHFCLLGVPKVKEQPEIEE